MGAEQNLITTNEMRKVREVDFVQRFTHRSLAKLVEALGVTRKIPMQEGTTMYVYETTGTLESGVVAEGDVIPLSKYETTKTPVGEITLKKWRKAVSAEAIKKSGYNASVNDTDAALLRDVQAGIRTDFFGLLNGTITGSDTATGSTLQAALANAWGVLQVKFEDDTAEAVYFVNPTDIAEYLATAQISTQTAFGMNYIENFLGLGTVIISSKVTAGTFIATAKENLIMYYLTINGDVANAFELTSDELGYIGIKSGYQNEERAQIESLVMSGIQFFVEYAAGVVKGTIGDDPVTYTVTNNLTNVETSNTATVINEGDSYTATLTAETGYEIDEVSVTMGGSDITSTAYTAATGVVSIEEVTGNIVITATAKE